MHSGFTLRVELAEFVDYVTLFHDFRTNSTDSLALYLLNEQRQKE